MKSNIHMNSEVKTENLRNFQAALRYIWTSKEYSYSPLPLRFFAGSLSPILHKFQGVKTQQLSLSGFSNKSGNLLWPSQKESVTPSTVFLQCFTLIYTPILPFIIPHNYLCIYLINYNAFLLDSNYTLFTCICSSQEIVRNIVHHLTRSHLSNEWMMNEWLKDQNHFSLERSYQHREVFKYCGYIKQVTLIPNAIPFTTITELGRLIHSPIVKKPHSVDSTQRQAKHFRYTVLHIKHTLSNQRISDNAKNKTVIKKENLHKQCLPLC